MSTSILSGLTNVGVDAAKFHAVQNLKTFLTVCKNFPPVLNTVAPIIEKSTAGLISREKLKELAMDPNKLDGEIEEQLMKAAASIDLKAIAAKVPGMSHVYDLGQKTRETISKTVDSTVKSVAPAAGGIVNWIKRIIAKFTGLKMPDETISSKDDSSKTDEARKLAKSPSTDSSKSTEESKKANQAEESQDTTKPGFIKRMWKNSPLKTIFGAFLGLVIFSRIVLPVSIGIVKTAVRVVTAPFRMVARLFGKKAEASKEDNLDSLDEASNKENPEQGLSEQEELDAAGEDGNIWQKGLTAGHEYLKNSNPLWGAFGHHVTNKIKDLAPGKNKKIQAESGGSGGMMGGKGGGLGALPGLFAK